MQTSKLHVRVRAKRALFTRPEYRTERMTNVTASQAGWEGVFNQVMGHKGCRYKIEEAKFLFYPRYFSITGNELQSFGSGRAPVDTEKKRTLRTSTVLAGKRRRILDDDWGDEREVSGVDYILTLRLITPAEKYFDMLLSRLKKGNYYGTQPFLGMREYPCRLDLIEDPGAINYPLDIPDLVAHSDGFKTVPYSERLGLCFYGTDWDDPLHPNYFTALDIKDGVVKYPTWEQVRREGIKRENPS